MCTINNEVKHLEKLRSKGHKLIKCYKFVRVEDYGVFSSIYKMEWKKGWNHALNGKGNPVRKTTPFKENFSASTQFHMYARERGYIHSYLNLLVVWVYADEITACEDEGRDDEGRDNYVVTASRVLVKTLPKKR